MRVRVFLCVLCVLCASAPLRWKLFFSSAVATRLPQWAESRPSHKPVSCVAGRAKRAGATEMHQFIYLASQSPRRRQLLEQLGVRHELLLAGPDEDAEALEAEVDGELPLAYVERVTRAKLQAARTRLKARRLPAAPILCSDTTVALGRRLLGKPADAAAAQATLEHLAGRTHRVITAVALAWGRNDDALAISV